MRCLRSLPTVVSLLLFGSLLIGQSPQTAPRIHGPVDESSLVVLRGNVPSLARAEFDRGEAPASTQLSHVRLVLARSTEQQAALDQYDAELLDKSSPNYHKWLTPEQFGKLYGPADSDIAAIIAWLQSHGVQVDPVQPGRTNISFSGTVSQIEELLHVSIHSFEVNGEQFFSNTNNPSIPAALAQVISGVARLNTLKPKPHHVVGQMGLYDHDAGRMKAISSARPHADLTTGSGTSSDPFFLYVVPGDAATIYDTPNTTLNANFPSSGTSYTGSGVTIGVGGDATINAATVVDYRQKFLGDTKQPTISYCGPFTSPSATPACSGSSTGIGTSDQGEAYLDVELSGGLAPGATIHYYASSDLWGAIEAAINENKVDIFSLSFGACELDLTTADNQVLYGWWQQAASQGIAVTVSTGDNGSAGCDNNNTETAATAGLMVSGYASTPYNIAVGGTDFGPLLTSFTTYASPTSSNSSSTLYRTALKYIPEWTWNDSTYPNTTISANVPYIDPNSMKGNIVAASGGKSTCSTNTTTYDNMGNETRGTCTSGYSKPSWQRGTGQYDSDGSRDLPDISLMAGAGGDAAAWLVCTDDTGTVGGITVTANCTKQSDGNFYFGAFGGTSTATPAFAGILALVQQKTGGRLGQAAKGLYDLYNGSHASAIFHDVTTGNISVPCASTPSVSPNCAKNTAGYYFLTGYDTGAGYDLASGIGSVDVNQLITYWGSATGGATATVTVVPSSSTINRADPLTVSVTVKGSSTSGNPTGTVTLSGGGYTSSAETLTASGADSATYTFNIPGNTFNIGSDTLSVSYSGDATYASATGAAPLTVNGLTPTVTVVPGSTNVNSGASLMVTATVAGTGATPTGTVTLYYARTTSLGTGTLDSTGKYTFTVPPFTFRNAGSTGLRVSYSGDSNYSSADGTAQITIIISTFTLSATDVSLTAGATSGNASTVTVTPAAGYTGAVTLTAAVTSSPSGAVSAPSLTGSTVNITNASSQTGTVTVATTAATAVRAGGPGSAWFKAAGGTAFAAFLLFFLPLGFRRGRRILGVLLVLAAATFTAVGCGGGHSMTTPTVTVTPSKTTFASSTAITVAVSVSGGSSTPTGSVTLTGGGFSSSAASLSNGTATINIPANSLSVGSVTLTASYTGDTNFNSATGTSSVTVNKPGTTAGNYTVTVTATGNDAASTKATTTFTLTVN